MVRPGNGGTFMSGCTGCGSCASGCGGCQSHILLLTEAEIRLLRRFGELAFLPAACTRTNETPVYLSDLGGRAEISAAILALQVKRLISVDFACRCRASTTRGMRTTRSAAAWP